MLSDQDYHDARWIYQAERSSLPALEAYLHASLNVILTGHISDLMTDDGYHSAIPAIHNTYEPIAS
jgi:hypothetical protein